MPSSSSPTPRDLRYDVKIWNLTKYVGKRKTTHRVRWAVAGREHREGFATAKLAESFRAELVSAAKQGIQFSVSTGRPVTMRRAVDERTWLQHAAEYTRIKWPHSSPRHRRGIAEALTDITLVIYTADNRPPESHLRRALFSYSFNASPRRSEPTEEVASALRWLERNSPNLGTLEEATILRAVLDRLALRQDGAPAAASTIARKRATLHSVLEYAVELERFTTNPLKRVRWKSPQTSNAVDRRVVVNPVQARELIAAVLNTAPALAAFFACLYYAGLRPAEARNLRRGDLALPETGWGRILLTGSHQTAGAAWTDSGQVGEERGLKHRSRQDTRPVPAHPELVAWLRWHLSTFALGPDGRLFVTRTTRGGRPLSAPFCNPVAPGAIYRAWQQARQSAFSPQVAGSMLARRPYDLRHACLTTWLNAGVPPARVAEWAGHSVHVLLRVYAKCVDGDDEVALRRIEAALLGASARPDTNFAAHLPQIPATSRELPPPAGPDGNDP